MDVLKILTRSTKLNKKSGDGRAPQARQVPSSGAPSHPQALAEPALLVHTTKSRGTKRKRGGVAVAQDDLDIPDFFGSGKTVVRQEEDDSDSNLKIEATPTQDVKNSPRLILSLEERKQLLRKHKLKVSLVRKSPGVKAKDGKVKNRKKAVAKKDTASFEEIYPQPIQNFKELEHTRLSMKLQNNLKDEGYTVPTEVQMAALSILIKPEKKPSDLSMVRADHIDLMTVAPTGSGKTLAFLIPLMNDLMAQRASLTQNGGKTANHDRHVRAIVLAPTHELAEQIANEASKLARGTGLSVTAMKEGHLYQEFKDNALGTLIKSDIVVSTPLRLANSLDLNEDSVNGSLPRISHLVLDEADVLLDRMFREQTMKIWEQCSAISLRVSLWSATMGASIESFATEQIFGRLAKDDEKVRNDHRLIRVIAGLKDSAIPNVRHHMTYAATEQGKLLGVRQLLHPSTPDSSSGPIVRPPFLVFTQTIPRAVALHSELLYDISVEAGGSSRIAVLHSDLSFDARDKIMTRFRKGEIWVLIATDLLSRGVDFRGVNGVVNYDIPTSGAGYVHRAGRTGRAGREGGVCVTFYTKEDIPYVKNIANVIAAAEKLKGKKLGDEGTAMPQWLLDALPDLSKETKKELKKKGVAARRSGQGGKVEGKGKMRISTKSGYERKLENRRKAAKNNEREANAADGVDGSDGSDGFGGFDD